MENKPQTAATSTIVYKGTVTIKRVDKKGRIKSIKKYNSGKQGLFNFLLSCLAYKFREEYKPCKLMAYTDAEGLQPALSTIVVQLNAPVLYRLTESGSYVRASGIPYHRVEYAFQITASSILDASKPIQKLKLLNNSVTSLSNIDDTSICAELSLETSPIEMSKDNLLIYWDLEFQENATVTTQQTSNNN